jgi:hypothetical protein
MVRQDLMVVTDHASSTPALQYQANRAILMTLLFSHLKTLFSSFIQNRMTGVALSHLAQKALNRVI